MTVYSIQFKLTPYTSASYVENSLQKREVTDTSHSVYIIENGNIEPELKINVSHDLKKTAFDIKSLKEEGDHFQGKKSSKHCFRLIT